jgi:hypothetical protein
MRVRLHLSLTLSVLALAGSAAFAQSSGDKAAADALFDEGKQLIAAGDVDKACAKFEASLKLVEQLGTRMNLADCYEKLGRTASAWAEFREAASLARKRNDRRESFAADRAASLEPKLLKMTINVPAASRVPGLIVRRDGLPIGEALYDTPVPTDPGKHVVEAYADGYKPWSTDVEVGAHGASVEVPKLVTVPRPSGLSAADPADEARHARKTRHVIGLVVAGVGVAALGVSAVLGLTAKGKWDDASRLCDPNNVCDAEGYQLSQDARSLGDTATIVAGAGAAVLVTGVIVYITAPKEPAEKPVVGIAPRQGGLSVSIMGRF